MTESQARNSTQGRGRLDAIAHRADPETRRHLDELGLCEGWNCLEIGAGSGSLAEWIASRVTPGGRVVATDLETKSLDKLAVANLEVRRHDVDTEALPTSTYDLVVGRYLFEWLKSPQAVLDKIVSSLVPDGWVLLQSDDWGALPPASSGAHEQMLKVREAFFEFHGRSSGYNPDIGRQLVGMLEAAGLEAVGATGRSVLLRGGSPEVQLYKYDVELAGAQMVDAGRITSADLAAVLKIYDDPKFCMMSPLTITAWGRRRR
jgi:SAM-dependent methyltransferase